MKELRIRVNRATIKSVYRRTAGQLSKVPGHNNVFGKAFKRACTIKGKK